MMASTPAALASAISLSASEISLSKRIVFSVMNMRTPNLWAYSVSLRMSSIEFPAAWRAPNAGPAIYTASAPQSIAAMPMSIFLAGARSSRNFIGYLLREAIICLA